MKYLKLSLLVIAASFTVNAVAADYYGKTIKYVYQRDDVADTEFEFRLIDAGNHSCNGTVYLVQSPTTEIANRKFSMMVTAVVSGKKVDFGSDETCSPSNRKNVSWVRVTNQ